MHMTFDPQILFWGILQTYKHKREMMHVQDLHSTQMPVDRVGAGDKTRAYHYNGVQAVTEQMTTMSGGT
jgi:hypothetical protein